MVGDTVKQHASEDANVVVGCVIDPEMREEIRVTVVATGIGRTPAKPQQPTAAELRKMTPVPGAGVPGRGVRHVPTLEDLHVPTYIRHQREGQAARRAVGDGLSAEDTSMLDIPAFLRRQAD
jgi:cell division protein FtsZ